MALGLLTAQIVFGLVLSHPTNKTTWRLSRLLFPWHENAWVFILSFLGVHVLATLADAYANVGFLGAFVPGLSEYRTPGMALGTMALAFMSLDAEMLGLGGILAVVFLIGIAAGFERPALTAFEAQVIPIEHATRGASWTGSMWTGGATGSSEYFLVEHRSKFGFDAGLPGNGLIFSTARWAGVTLSSWRA